jgi:hypothetical protein
VQINIPNCDGKKSEPPKDNIQTKCNNTKCKATYGLDKQIELKMNGNKVLNASNFKFSVKLDGDTCDLNVFQKTFARLKLDGKIIQDITIPANTKKREFNFDNI